MYTHLELQKLVYLAHMFHLVKEENQPLVENRFEAWEWGACSCGSLLQIASSWGVFDPKTFRRVEDFEIVDEMSTKARWLRYISECFPPGNGARLLSITHNKHSAWK